MSVETKLGVGRKRFITEQYKYEKKFSSAMSQWHCRIKLQAICRASSVDHDEGENETIGDDLWIYTYPR